MWPGKATALAENSTEEEWPQEAGQHPDVIMYWSLSVAIFSVGGMLSSFLIGFVGNLRGR